MKKYGMWINGQEVESAGGQWMDTFNPSNGELLGQVPLGNSGDIALAYEAGMKAQQEWIQLPPLERGNQLRKFASLIREKMDEIALLDALDSGNPIDAMRKDVSIGADYLDYYGGLVVELKGETIPASNEGFHYTLQEPYGVVGRILPYNHPAMFALEKMAAPLAAGNAIIIKPADQTPLSTIELAKLSARFFPDGLINVVTGNGVQTGAAISKHPHIKRIAFTGSARTGQRIIADSAPYMKQVSMELGGKNPLIVFPDADVEQAVKQGILGMNYHISAGQSCGSNSRILLHTSIYKDFTECYIEELKKIRLGDATDADTDMGPVISKTHQKNVIGYIEQAMNEKQGKLAYGGPKPPEDVHPGGYYVQPTVFTDVDHSSAIAQEEIFGPVCCFFKWDAYEEAIQMANDVEYGLTANVWTNELQTARKAVKDLQAGYVWMNGDGRHFVGTPFGGYKMSGLGREEGISELFSYTQTKTVHEF